MKLVLEDAIAILENTPQILRELLGSLPDTGPGERDAWSPYDVVGHFIHGEKTDWIPRARLIVDYGESRPFEPFDRLAQFDASQGKTLGVLLDEFAFLRRENLAILRAMKLQPQDLARTGTHPELGRVTLEQLIATWAVHDLDHLQQVITSIAREYTENVGPWRAYLGVLNP